MNGKRFSDFRVCPKCRGYSIERVHCNVCNGIGFIERIPREEASRTLDIDVATTKAQPQAGERR